MNKHTHKSWRVGQDGAFGISIWSEGEDERHIADVKSFIHSDRVQHARLIAAAPDMLEALKSTARGLEGEFGPRVAEVNFPALYAAIAKAEGGSS